MELAEVEGHRIVARGELSTWRVKANSGLVLWCLLTRGCPWWRNQSKGGCQRGTGQVGVGIGGGVRGHHEATVELGPDRDRSSRLMMGCAWQRKAGDAELVWVHQSSTCLTVGALAQWQHGLTGRAPRRS
jgi:hypothetical protein